VRSVSTKVIITSNSLAVSLCANSRHRQADCKALARPRMHISGDGISSSGRLHAVSVTRFKTSIKRWVPNNRRVSNKRSDLLDNAELSEYQPYMSYVTVLTQIIPIIVFWLTK